MEATSDQCFPLMRLPSELRLDIYDRLAEDVDLLPLMRTCRAVRSEILARLPGGTSFDYEQLEDDGLLSTVKDRIEVKNLNIIVEPWLSPRSFLKFEVTWRLVEGGSGLWSTSRWTVCDMSSPLAKYIYLYYYNTITITFKAATRGCLLFALLTLHTKVLDIIHLLANVPSRLPDPIPSAQHYQPLSVHFSGGKDPSRPGYKRKSFWEMRPGHIRTRQEILAGKKCGMPIRISRQGREKYPYFYECLMLPLFSSKQWMLGTVSFDVEPADRCSTYRWTANLPLGMKHYRYLGYQKLIQVASKRWQVLRDEPDSIPPDIDEVKTHLDNFTDSLSALTLKVKCEEATQLRAYLQRMRLSGSTCNYFAPVSDTPIIFGWVPAGFAWSIARRQLFLPTKEDCEQVRWWLIEWACPSESRLIQFTTPGLSIIHGLGP